MPAAKPPPLFLLALVLALVSGAAGLAHEIIWTRRLVDLLGASPATFSKVIGAFFLGLAFGAWLGARPARPCANFWARVAAAEVAVGVLALPALFCLHFTPSALLARPAFKLAGALFLVTPPAVAMGLVVPWLMRALAQRGILEPARAVWIYAANTFGGVLGIGAVLFLALPALGLTGAGYVTIVTNLLAGLVACAGAGTPADAGATVSSFVPAASVPASAPVRTHAIGFFSGCLVLAFEVILQHQLAQVTINSLFSSGLVLGLVLVGLGLAAALAERWAHRWKSAKRALAAALLSAAILSAAEPFGFSALRPGLRAFAYEQPPAQYAMNVLFLGLIAVIPVLLAVGLVFPLLLNAAVGSGDSAGSQRAGLLLAWNGLGGWFGAEIGQSLLAPALGLWTTCLVISCGYLALCFACLDRAQTRRRAVLLAVPLAGAVALTQRLPQASLNRGERLAAVAVGREGVVATVECGPGDWRMLFNNSYTLGGSKAQFNQERQAHLPLLLHAQARRVAMLGVATGSTVAGAVMHPAVDRIDAIELSPLVLRQAENFFEPYNRFVFREPRVQFIAEDARTVMASQVGVYDVVVGDLFLPWRTGEGRLFALEHFRNVQRSLKPGGLFCQWLPMFQLTRPQFDAIARTFGGVFPDVFLVRGDFYAERPILGLVGGVRFERLDWERIDAACERLRLEGKATDPLIRHREGVAMLLLGPRPALPAGPLNTLGNAWLEWNAARNVVGLTIPWFVGVPCAEYVREIQRASVELLPFELRAPQDAGQFFLTLEIAAKLQLPVLDNFKAQVSSRLPASLREDNNADWRQWPMRVKPNGTASPVF